MPLKEDRGKALPRGLLCGRPAWRMHTPWDTRCSLVPAGSSSAPFRTLPAPFQLCYSPQGAGTCSPPDMNCLSLFKRKKEKQGTDLIHESQQHQPGRKAPTYENVSDSPIYATVSKPKNMKQDDSIHYADIQVFTKIRERSAEEVKNLQMQNATEYATLNFPRPRLKYDSKNGTLV